MRRVFVGVDGGGTRTRCVAVDGEFVELARAEADAGLVDAAAPTAGVAALAALIRSVLAQCGHEPPAEAVCCALAGAGREEQRQRVRSALAAEGLGRKLLVVTDAEAAMQACFGSGPGVLVICGTGSIAWARSADGRLLRAGGWGHRIGDEGSAYAIGIEALRCVARAHDGRGPATALTARVLAATGAASAEQLIPWAARAAKGYIAALAPHVMELAASDDAARVIVERAVADLFDHLRAIHDRIGGVPVDLVFAGGMLAPGSVLRERLAAEVGTLPDLHFRDEAAGDAALGAAALARAAAD